MNAFEDQSQLRGAHLQERIGNTGLWILSLTHSLTHPWHCYFHYL